MMLSTFKTIVVGVDFSNYSKIVVRQAAQLAEKFETKLIFVHSIKNISLMTGEVPLDLENDFIRPLSKEVISFYKLKKIAPNSTVIVSVGRASDTIITAAKEAEAPLIVVGHKGATATALGHFFLGSTAEQLALHSPFPVWIHRGNTAKVPNKVLLPCDFSDRTTKSVQTVKGLNDFNGAQYEFLHIAQEPSPIVGGQRWKKAVKAFRKNETVYRKKFQALYPDIPLKCVSGDPAQLIVKESKKFDLVAMAPNNREGLFSTFGSVTAKVVRSGEIPVLISH